MGYSNTRDDVVEEKKQDDGDNSNHHSIVKATNNNMNEKENRNQQDLRPDDESGDDLDDKQEQQSLQNNGRPLFSFGDPSNQVQVQTQQQQQYQQHQQTPQTSNSANEAALLSQATQQLLLEQVVAQQRAQHPAAPTSLPNLNQLSQLSHQLSGGGAAASTNTATTSLTTLINNATSSAAPSTIATIPQIPQPPAPPAAVMSMVPFSSPTAVAQLQQQVLAQQQAAAQAAAMSIGAVTSCQAHHQSVIDHHHHQQQLSQLAAPAMVHQHQQPSTAAPVIYSPGAGVAPPFSGLNFANNVNSLVPTTSSSSSPTSPLNPLGTVAGGPLSTLPNLNHSLTIPTGPGAPTTAISAATNATTNPATHHHRHNLSPQHTIPHYVPPIPATWGAQIPALTVQDRPLVPPIYNGINPNYPGAQMLHANPPIFAVENFLSPAECDFLIEAAGDALGPAPVVGKGAGEVSASRTSSTCYLAREDLPEYLRKISLLTGKPAEHCELPQVGRYLPSQQYLQHFDAFDLSNEDGRRFASNGGQRTITCLTYLNDVPRGGATSFPNLNIEVQPRRGMCLVFFPSTLDGLLDKMALHAAMPAVDTKYISQVWIRQSNYDGRPSKRLAAPMVAGLQERRDREELEKQQMAAAVAHQAQAQLLMMGQLQLQQQQVQQHYPHQEQQQQQHMDAQQQFQQQQHQQPQLQQQQHHQMND